MAMAQYWFRPKQYGYGATPATWEGWAATVASLVLLAGSLAGLQWLAGPGNLTAWLLWAVVAAAGIWWFAQFTRRRTDGEWRWRWGDES